MGGSALRRRIRGQLWSLKKKSISSRRIGGTTVEVGYGVIFGVPVSRRVKATEASERMCGCDWGCPCSSVAPYTCRLPDLCTGCSDWSCCGLKETARQPESRAKPRRKRGLRKGKARSRGGKPRRSPRTNRPSISNTLGVRPYKRLLSQTVYWGKHYNRFLDITYRAILKGSYVRREWSIRGDIVSLLNPAWGRHKRQFLKLKQAMYRAAECVDPPHGTFADFLLWQFGYSLPRPLNGLTRHDKIEEYLLCAAERAPVPTNLRLLELSENIPQWNETHWGVQLLTATKGCKNGQIVGKPPPYQSTYLSNHR